MSNINQDLTSIPEHLKFACSVDCVVLGYDEGKLKVLLIETKMPPYAGMHSLIGDL